MTWPVVAPVATASTALVYGTYNWFLTGVGMYLGYGHNIDAYNEMQINVADWIVQRGAQQFYNPPMAPGSPVPHNWSFLMLKATIATAGADADYDLPTGCTGHVEDITYQAAAAKARVELISELAFRAIVGKVASNTGDPKYAAVRPKALATTTAQVYELLLYPTPAGILNLDYRYKAHPGLLTTTNLYAQGTSCHAETIMCSCLSIAELYETKASGPMHQRFLERLAASIAIDRNVGIQDMDLPRQNVNVAPSK